MDLKFHSNKKGFLILEVPTVLFTHALKHCHKCNKFSEKLFFIGILDSILCENCLDTWYETAIYDPRKSKDENSSIVLFQNIMILHEFEEMIKSLKDVSLYKNYNIEEAIVEQSEVNGLMVSTVNTPDRGYETAILDVNNVYVVERYNNAEDAINGHISWCINAKEIEEIKPIKSHGFRSTYPVKLIRKK